MARVKTLDIHFNHNGCACDATDINWDEVAKCKNIDGDMQWIPAEHKYDSWGLLNGRIVAVDYNNFGDRQY